MKKITILWLVLGIVSLIEGVAFGVLCAPALGAVINDLSHGNQASPDFIFLFLGTFIGALLCLYFAVLSVVKIRRNVLLGRNPDAEQRNPAKKGIVLSVIIGVFSVLDAGYLISFSVPVIRDSLPRATGAAKTLTEIVLLLVVIGVAVILFAIFAVISAVNIRRSVVCSRGEEKKAN